MIKSVKPIMMEEDHGLLTPGCVVEMPVKLYILFSKGWDIFEHSSVERCLGIFSSSELAVKAANDYLKKISNDNDAMGYEVYNTDGLILPTDPLTYNMLDVNGEEPKTSDGYEYLNNNNMYGAYLYIIDTYTLNEYSF